MLRPSIAYIADDSYMADVVVTHGEGESDEGREAVRSSALELGRELEHLRTEDERLQHDLIEHRLAAGDHPAADITESLPWQTLQTRLSEFETRIGSLEQSASRLPEAAATVTVEQTERMEAALKDLSAEISQRVEEGEADFSDADAVPEEPLVVEVTAPSESRPERRSLRGALGGRLHRHRK